MEEHLILRIQDKSLCESLKTAIKDKTAHESLSLQFTSERQATIKWSDQNPLPATLYDLPCIIESHKSFDNKLFHKIADISCMLVVGGDLPAGEAHPHGLTAPLKYVRKRRFRRRISKKAIEDVEREIERLLTADAEADDVKYGD